MPILSRGWTSLRSISSVENFSLSGFSLFDWSRRASVFAMLELPAFMVTLFPPSTRLHGLLLVWLLSLEARTALCFPARDRFRFREQCPWGLPFRLSRLIADPFERSCCNQAHDQEVVSAKTGRVLPI